MVELRSCKVLFLFLLPFIGLRNLPKSVAAASSDDPIADPGTLKSRLNFKPSSLNRKHILEREASRTSLGRGDSLPDFLRTIYSKAAKDGKLTTPYKDVNEIKVYPDRSGIGNKYTFQFSIPQRESQEVTEAIELRFFTKPYYWYYASQLTHVYQIITTNEDSTTQDSNSDIDSTPFKCIYLTSAYVNYTQNQQQVILINKTHMFNHDRLVKHKIRLVLTPEPIAETRVENPNQHTNRDFHDSLYRNQDQAEFAKRPILVYYVTDKLNIVEPSETSYPTVGPLVNKRRDEAADSEMRMRRSLPGYTRNPCRLVPFVANFTEIGWTKDFVIGPETFEMNLCMGECPWPNDQRFNATNHAIMQGTFSAYNTYVGRNKVPQPCCVPDKLMPLPLLYMEPSQNVILKTFRDMVAAHCGCY